MIGMKLLRKLENKDVGCLEPDDYYNREDPFDLI